MQSKNHQYCPMRTNNKASHEIDEENKEEAVAFIGTHPNSLNLMNETKLEICSEHLFMCQAKWNLPYTESNQKLI